MDESLNGKNAGVGIQKVDDAIKGAIKDAIYDDDDDDKIVEGSLSSSSIKSTFITIAIEGLHALSSIKISGHDNTKIINTKTMFLFEAIFAQMQENQVYQRI